MMKREVPNGENGQEEIAPRTTCPRCSLNVPAETLEAGEHQCNEDLIEAKKKLAEKEIEREIGGLEEERKSSPHLQFEEYYLRKRGRLRGEEEKEH